MSTNQYFNNYSYAPEQNLIEDLNLECIKMYGHNVKYMPRTLVNEDLLFGEDPLSQFSVAATIEMYIKNVEGFEGEGDLLSRFGLEIRDNITFSVAQKRFGQFKTEKLITEFGYQLLLETGDMIKLEDAVGDNYTITLTRPMEGDLIYFPMVGKLFEVKFVEHEAIFYQMGALQTYDLRCELFTYASERLGTGDATIDAIETSYSTDMLFYEMLLEDETPGASAGDKLLLEDGGSMISESYRVETFDKGVNTEFFGTKVLSDEIVDFSEWNPFGDNIY